MHHFSLLLHSLLLLVPCCVADDVEASTYDVKVKGAFGINTTSAEVKLDKSEKTVTVIIKSDSSEYPTYAGGQSYFDVKNNFVALQPDPLQDRCLLFIPATPMKIKDARDLLEQPSNNGRLPYQSCLYKNYIPSAYDQAVQDAATTVCKIGNFSGVLQDCQPAAEENVRFCLLSGVLTSSDKPFLGCIAALTT